jgi:glycosyltransferase involved in cell wall biosynthesis
METQGLVYLDSIASGTPLIALEGNAVADAVAANGTGVTVRNLAELPDAMEHLRANWTAYAASCASVAAGRYSETTWVSERIGLYRSLCAESRSTA